MFLFIESIVMTTPSSISFTIPSIDGGIAPTNPDDFSRQQRQKLDRLVNAPSSLSGWALLEKMAL